MTPANPLRQVGALPYRSGANGLEVLLVTSRETKRWVVPKGNLISGLEDYLSAAREAFEEGGVIGHPSPDAIGSYRYVKLRKTGLGVPAEVTVYPLPVATLLATWPEAHERERQWFAQGAAAEAVAEPDLAELIRSFSPAATA